MRIHRSFIINTNKIDTVSCGEITLGRHTLPEGRTCRERVKGKLEIS